MQGDNQLELQPISSRDARLQRIRIAADCRNQPILGMQGYRDIFELTIQGPFKIQLVHEHSSEFSICAKKTFIKNWQSERGEASVRH